MTINTIRIGAQIVYLDSVIIFWPRARANTFAKLHAVSKTEKREMMLRVCVNPKSPNTQIIK